MVKVMAFVAVFTFCWPCLARAQGSDGGLPFEANPAQPSVDKGETESAGPVPAQASAPVGQAAPVSVPCKVWMLPAPRAPAEGIDPAQQDDPSASLQMCLPGHTCFFVQCPSLASPSSPVVLSGAFADFNKEHPPLTVTARETTRGRALARSRPRLVLGARLAWQPVSQSVSVANHDTVLGAELYAGVRNHVGPRVGMELSAGGSFLFADMCYSYTSSGNYCDHSKYATTISMAFVEGSLILGPHGRFYLAPLLWAGFRGFSASAVAVGERAVSFPSSGLVAGAGLRSGAFLGGADAFDLHVAIRVAGGEEKFVLITTGGSFAP